MANILKKAMNADGLQRILQKEPLWKENLMSKEDDS